MTRINVVPVAELCDKHLLAEYRELPRVYKLAKMCSDAPNKYTLGKGHVKFFYDKMVFICKRHRQLIEECYRRGFNITLVKIPVSYVALALPKQLHNDYKPTREALRINRARIEERKSQFKRKEKLNG